MPQPRQPRLRTSRRPTRSTPAKWSASTAWSRTSALDGGYDFPGRRPANADLRDLQLELRRRHRPLSPASRPAPRPANTPWLSPCAASVLHTYQYGGTYNVTLTVTDVGGNTASVTHQVTVIGPAPRPAKKHRVHRAPRPRRDRRPPAPVPAAAAPRAEHPAASASCRTPLAAAAVVSADAAQRRYAAASSSATRSTSRSRGTSRCCSAARIARTARDRRPTRLRPARRLAPPQVVIGKAILVTTKGGRSDVTIQFSKRTAPRSRACAQGVADAAADRAQRQRRTAPRRPPCSALHARPAERTRSGRQSAGPSFPGACARLSRKTKYHSPAISR